MDPLHYWNIKTSIQRIVQHHYMQKVLEKLISISHPSYRALLSSIISLNLLTHCKKPKSGAASRLYAENSAGLA